MIQRNYIDQFSYMRVLASFCVIVLNSLYTSNAYFSATITEGEVFWTRIMETQLMWAMPIFLMITGVLLLDEDRDLSLKRLFGKYLRRMILALACFTLIFQILGYWQEGETDIFTGWMKGFFLGESWEHVWYLYLMIGLYLMMPFYQMIAKAVGDRMMDYLLILLLVFTSILPTLNVFGLYPGFYIPTMVVFPVYLFLGYRLYHRPLPLWAAWACLVFFTAAIFTITYLRFGTDVFAGLDDSIQSQMDTLTGYSSILVIGQVAGLFSLMCRIQSPAGEIMKGVDKCTFGIYLLHMIGIHMVMKWWGFDPYMYGPFAFILMAAGFFVISLGITWVIRRIPRLDLL